MLATAWLVPAALAVVPAGLRFWWERSLRAEDPLLPERMIAMRSRGTTAAAATFVLLAVGWTGDLFWTVPLLVYARHASHYALRRRIYGETWTLWRYLAIYTRSVIAFFGFWLALLATPTLIGYAGSYDWVAAVFVGLMLVAWSREYPRIACFVLGTRPVDDAGLRVRFDQLVARAAVPAPRFERLTLGGGTAANAVALPHERRAAVVFTDALLALDADEVVAVCAHELAHLEYYSGARIRREKRLTLLLVVLAASVTPVVRVLAPEAVGILPVLWGVVLFGVLVGRARHRQKNETASDLRAIDLAGDPEALVRALTRIHAIARLPRRWDARFEARATHPSLARRIQAIRARAGTVPAPLSAPTVVGGSSTPPITLHADRIEWHESDGVSHSFAYGALKDLRVAIPSWGGSVQLAVVETTGRSWAIPVDVQDVARLQAALDTVDHRIPRPVSQAHSSSTSMAVAALTALIALTVSQTGVIVAAVLALLRPGAPLVAALGAAAITAATVTLRDLHGGDTVLVWSAVALLGCGITAIGMARASRADERGRGVQRFVTILAACAALTWIVALLGGLQPVSLYRSARAWPSAAVLSVALGAALVFMRKAAVRAASLPVTAAGIAFAALGTTTFLDRASGDALVGPAQPIESYAMSPRPIDEFSVDFLADEIHASPNGRFVILGTSEDEEKKRLYVGEPGGRLAPLDGDQACFADEWTVLVLSHTDNTSIVRQLPIANLSRRLSEHATARLYAERLSVDAATGRWRLVGAQRKGDVVAVEGRVGSADVRETRWAAPPDQHGWYAGVTQIGEDAFVAETVAELPALRRATLARFLLPRMGHQTRFWLLQERSAVNLGTTQLDAGCQSQTADGRPICTAFDGLRTRLFALDPVERRFKGMITMNGRVMLYGSSGGDKITGWWNSVPVVVDPVTYAATWINLPAGERPVRIAVTSGQLMSVFWGDGRSTIRSYRGGRLE